MLTTTEQTKIKTGDQVVFSLDGWSDPAIGNVIAICHEAKASYLIEFERPLTFRRAGHGSEFWYWAWATSGQLSHVRR